MIFLTGAEAKTIFLRLLRAHWPIIVILILTYFAGLERREHMGRVVQTIGAAGVIVLLPIFKLQKTYDFIYHHLFYVLSVLQK